MSNESATIVQRLWNCCNVLRDDGELEEELDGALPCRDDMVRAERLRACPDSRSAAGLRKC